MVQEYKDSTLVLPLPLLLLHCHLSLGIVSTISRGGRHLHSEAVIIKSPPSPPATRGSRHHKEVSALALLPSRGNPNFPPTIRPLAMLPLFSRFRPIGYNPTKPSPTRLLLVTWWPPIGHQETTKTSLFCYFTIDSLL